MGGFVLPRTGRAVASGRRARLLCAALLLLIGLTSAGLASVATAQTSAGPPPAPVRQPAEFEPAEGVMIRWPLAIPVALIAEMSEDVVVVTTVADAAQQAAATSLYQGAGVNMANCSFLVTPTESPYSRDWGPWFVLDGLGQQDVIDIVYEWPNSPGDDAVPTVYAQSQGLPVYDLDLKSAGGNYMTDGQGTAIATDFVWFMNPTKTPAEIDSLLQQYLGIDTHHVLPDPGHYWLHIDCYAKYLDPDTILVSRAAPSHPMYQHLEDMADHLESQVSCWGTPYEVLRIYPADEFYTNSLILNDKVLVPLTGSQWDDDALAVYRRAMIGYEVIGFLGPWQPWDGLHCRTKELDDRHQLYVGHTPLLDRPPAPSGFLVRAEVVAYSGQPFTGGTPAVHWRTSGAWSTVPMTGLTSKDYVASIPAQPFGEIVRYYVQAEDASGRNESHPYIGAANPHSFTVTHLGSDVSGVSAAKGGAVGFQLNAGAANAGRSYLLLGSASGTSPGTNLPGGLVLPLNRDAFMGFVRSSVHTPAFAGFQGTLGAAGMASAQMDLGAALPGWHGETLHFAFFCYPPFDFVSNAVAVEVLD